MGNAQSQDKDAPPSSVHSHHSTRKTPIRKDSLNVPIKSSPTTATNQDAGLLLHAGGSYATGTTPSSQTAAEKLMDLTISDTGDRPSTERTTITGSDLDSPANVASTDRRGLSRKNSFGSVTTVDTVDDDEMNIDDSRSIPTAIVWPHEEGRKVYVTGTFSNWKKKFKLTEPKPGEPRSTIVNLPPGTHHVKFLVDGIMGTSNAMPTAVDAAGVLVNYIEVNADDMLPLELQDPQQSTAHLDPGMRTPSGIEHRASSFDFASLRAPKKYTNQIPVFLEDLEERQERYGRDFGSQLPPPPSLPMILSKVILNINTTIKDDASVLGIPNHVVLNHLATSSIKNHVLAISATTRYKKKYVSTILYKSTSTTE